MSLFLYTYKIQFIKKKKKKTCKVGDRGPLRDVFHGFHVLASHLVQRQRAVEKHQLLVQGWLQDGHNLRQKKPTLGTQSMTSCLDEKDDEEEPWKEIPGRRQTLCADLIQKIEKQIKKS